MASRYENKMAKALDKFRKNSDGKETYGDFDIVKLKFIIDWEGYDAEDVNVEELAAEKGMGTLIEERDGFLIFKDAVIRKSHVQKDLDLDNPIILVDGKVVDGHHRLYKAYTLGIATLKAHMLTSYEVRAC
jgi:hypothetical protein